MLPYPLMLALALADPLMLAGSLMLALALDESLMLAGPLMLAGSLMLALALALMCCPRLSEQQESHPQKMPSPSDDDDGWMGEDKKNFGPWGGGCRHRHCIPLECLEVLPCCALLPPLSPATATFSHMLSFACSSLSTALVVLREAFAFALPLSPVLILVQVVAVPAPL
jgi:hypothetical protein